MSRVNSFVRHGNAIHYVMKFLVLLGSFLGILAGCGGGGGSGGDGGVGNTTPVISSSFTATPSSGVAPLAVSFDASASSDNNSQITGFSWNLGDGQTSSGVTTNYTFTSPGNYTVTLTVVNANGESTTTRNTISVTGSQSTSTLSGSVIGATGSVVDSDVNDPNVANVSNNTPDQAQLISNPVMLGGYVNVAGTGELGPSFSPGDRSDFFRVSMVANQSLTLNIADHTTGDLDLFLYYDDGSIDPSDPDFGSVGTGKTETLIVSQDGDYIIEVYAFDSSSNPDDGYSNYALVVGQNVQSAVSHAADRLLLTDDFVPGDLIVRFNDAALTLSANQTVATRAASLGLQAKAGATGRAMLLELGDLQNRQSSFRTLGITSSRDGDSLRQYRSIDPKKQLKMDTLQVIKALRNRKDVLYAEPNYIRQAQKTPTDTNYKFQWHYPLINLPAAWDVTTGASNVIVAVIDTGILLNHPDLEGQFSADGGYDFIQDDSNSLDNDSGIDANANDPGDRAIGSSTFHGTHVAGTVAAATNFGGGGIGVAGVAPGVKIMPLRALGNLGGTAYDIMQAVRYAAGLSNDSGIVPAQKADVINLSLGGSSFSQEAQDLFTQVREAGVVVVAAAGNEKSGSLSYPASYDGVISVSAVDINKQQASYSNFGSAIDVAAPGGDMSSDVNGDGYGDGVLSTAGDDSRGIGDIDNVYKFFQGTSMASPHVAGVVALMASIYSDLTPADVDNLLSSGTIVEDLGTVGRDDQFGHGLIDARKAVDAATGLAQGTPPDTTFVSASPASLNLGVSATSRSLSIVNGGSGILSITSVDDDVAWLTVAPDSVDVSTNLGSYQVTVDRSGLVAGTYTANITIISSATPVTVPVILQVAGQDAGVDTDIGYHYTLLVDADTSEPIEQIEGAAQGGRYNFQFDNVVFSSEQRYFIVTGTDQDNDGFICDAGEACGAYISRDQPKAIAASDSHTGLDFVSGFNIGLQAQSQSVTDIPARGIAIRRLPTKRIP